MLFCCALFAFTKPQFNFKTAGLSFYLCNFQLVSFILPMLEIVGNRPKRERGKKKRFKFTMIYFIIDLNVTIVSHKDTE